MYTTSIFEEKVPSVIVVNSPFQVLCAIAAIRNLKIDQYRFIVCLNNDSRDSQMIKLLSSCNVNYQCKRINYINKLYILIKSIIPKKCRFHRLFIGDVRCMKLYLIGIGLISDHSTIIYLDDGIMTISYLANKIEQPLNKWFRLITLISSYRRIRLLRDFYSIYDNMSDEVYQKWNIKTNILKTLCLCENMSDSDTVSCIIGTNSSVYCSYLDLSIDFFYSMLENLFMHVKHMYPSCTIEYYAHGRDDNDNIKTICKNNGVVYVLPSKMVELSLLEKKKSPYSIWGFTSSALYNLKKLYPNTLVYNVRFHSNIRNAENEEYDFLTNYYERNGIVTKYLPLNN